VAGPLVSLIACLKQAVGVVLHRSQLITLFQTLMEPRACLDFDQLLKMVEGLYQKYNSANSHHSALSPTASTSASASAFPFSTPTQGNTSLLSSTGSYSSTDLTGSGSGSGSNSSSGTSSAIDIPILPLTHPDLRVLRENVLTETRILSRLFHIQLHIAAYKVRLHPWLLLPACCDSCVL
jgi:hypothetical protein